MEYLHSLLKFAVNMGASDIHIKPNHHAIIRIAGELFPVQVDPPSNEQVEEIVRYILPRHLETRLDREREVDFSYVDEALGRFRVNCFYQRGQPAMALRYVKPHISFLLPTLLTSLHPNKHYSIHKINTHTLIEPIFT